MKIGIQLPVVNTFSGAVWGDEVMAVGLARALNDLDGVTFAEVYDVVSIHDNLDVILHFYPFPFLRHIQGPRHYWWYQAAVHPSWLEDPRWSEYLALYDGIFVASPGLRDHLGVWGVPREKTSLMPMSCDLHAYRRLPPDARYSHDVVFCGNGGIRHADEVQRYLLPVRDLGLKIYGSMWENHPELQDCLLGSMPPRDVPALYSSAKIILSAHTMWHSGNGVPTSRLWEALACGAIVVSDRMPLAEQIFGDAIVWTDGYDDLREKVTRLLARDSERDAVRGRGRKIIEERAGFQVYAPKLLEIFRTGSMTEIFSVEKGEGTAMSTAGSYTGSGTPRDGGFPGDWIRQGEAAFEAGNTAEALRCFERALELDPFHAKAHSNLGVIYWQQGQIEKALNTLTRALELDPDDQDVILNSSMVFEIMGRVDDARDILGAYLQRNPWDDEVRRKLDTLGSRPQTQPPPQPGTACEENVFSPADFLNDQGEAQFENGRVDRARACFEMAIEADPDHAGAHCNLGVVFWQEGNLEKALEHLYRALELNPEDPDVLVNSARALAVAGENEASTQLYKAYLQRYPQDDAAWKDYEELLKGIGASTWNPKGLDPEVADVYLRMSAQLQQAGDLAGASDAIDRALHIDPDRAEAYYLLGCTHRDRDDCPAALALFMQGLEKDDSHKRLALAAGELLVAEGRKDEAEAIYDAFLSRSSDEEVRSALKKLKKRTEKIRRETKPAGE